VHVGERTARLASTKMSRDCSLEDRIDATTIADLRERGSQNKARRARHPRRMDRRDEVRSGSRDRRALDTESALAHTRERGRVQCPGSGRTRPRG